VLAGAAWLGAMLYSLLVLQPRARAYFDRPADFETFIAFVSHGARWKVLGVLIVIAATGAALVPLRWPEPLPATWLVLIGAKAGLLLAAVGLFVYVSWRLWPARVLATPVEIPQFQRAFRRVAGTMILIAGLGMTLGVVAHTW
jgi:hypothetical protein